MAGAGHAAANGQPKPNALHEPEPSGFQAAEIEPGDGPIVQQAVKSGFIAKKTRQQSRRRLCQPATGPWHDQLSWATLACSDV